MLRYTKLCNISPVEKFDCGQDFRSAWGNINIFCLEKMIKVIQVIDDADNCFYELYSATDDEFNKLFPDDTDVHGLYFDCRNVLGLVGFTLFYSFVKRFPY